MGAGGASLPGIWDQEAPGLNGGSFVGVGEILFKGFRIKKPWFYAQLGGEVGIILGWDSRAGSQSNSALELLLKVSTPTCRAPSQNPGYSSL